MLERYLSIASRPIGDVYLYNRYDEAVRKVTTNELNALVKLASKEHLKKYREEDIANDIAYYYFVVDGTRWYIYVDSVYPVGNGGTRGLRYEIQGVQIVDDSGGFADYALQTMM